MGLAQAARPQPSLVINGGVDAFQAGDQMFGKLRKRFTRQVEDNLLVEGQKFLGISEDIANILLGLCQPSHSFPSICP